MKYSRGSEQADKMKVTLQTKGGIFEYEARSDETLLAAGLRHGLTLPYECATGTCGTCRGRIMEGDAKMRWEEAPGAARLKRDKGDCLLCQTHIHSDAVVRVPSDQVSAGFDSFVVPEHHAGRIENCAMLTHDAMHFDIILHQPMRYDAGQFAIIETEGVPGARAYSMVSYDPGAERLGFVIKRKPGGTFSDWLFDESRDGADVRLFGPLGNAIFRGEENRDILCITGGSGIAGIMAILDRACQEDHFASHRGDVFFGVRTLEDGFYLDELAAFKRAAGANLTITLALSGEQAETRHHPEYPEISLGSGYVHDVAARQMEGRYGSPLGYVAGPPPMVDGAIRVLITQGKISADDIRYDKFG